MTTPTEAEGLHKILMDFRNTIQLERDRLYKTRDPDVTGVAQAHLKATQALQAYIQEQIRLAVIGELNDIMLRNQRLEAQGKISVPLLIVANRINELQGEAGNVSPPITEGNQEGK